MGIAGDLGTYGSLQAQEKRSGRNLGTWEETRAFYFLQRNRAKNFIPPKQFC